MGGGGYFYRFPKDTPRLLPVTVCIYITCFSLPTQFAYPSSSSLFTPPPTQFAVLLAVSQNDGGSQAEVCTECVDRKGATNINHLIGHSRQNNKDRTIRTEN